MKTTKATHTHEQAPESKGILKRKYARIVKGRFFFTRKGGEIGKAGNNRRPAAKEFREGRFDRFALHFPKA